MAAQISETYASPALRLGLLLEDHPKARVEYALVSGEEAGIPAEYGGSGKFCQATIIFPESTGIAPVVAHKKAEKPRSSEDPADAWNTMCTKTLGRALKKAGYPDDTKDLKALVLWRQRQVEINAIAAGQPVQQALPETSPVELALEAASTSPDAPTENDDLITENDDLVPPDLDDQIVDAEVVEGPQPPEDAPDPSDGPDREKVRKALNGLTTDEKANFKEWCMSQDIPIKVDEWDGYTLALVSEWLWS